MSSTAVNRATIIAGMAFFYMAFLLSVMKFFEEPEVVPLVMKSTQSVTVPDRVVVSVPNDYATVPAYQQPMAYVKSRTIVK